MSSVHVSLAKMIQTNRTYARHTNPRTNVSDAQVDIKMRKMIYSTLGNDSSKYFY